MSSIRRLPEEILLDIFLLVIANSRAFPTTFENWSGFLDCLTLTNLSQVCRHWREAIRNIPEVWKLVPFKGPGNFDASFACIERAKALPLTIFIDQRDPNWNGDEDNFTFGPNAMMDLLDKITEFRDRVEELHIVVNTWFVMQSALSWLQAQPPLPLLKRLELRRAGPQYVIIELQGDWTWFDLPRMPPKRNTSNVSPSSGESSFFAAGSSRHTRSFRSA